MGIAEKDKDGEKTGRIELHAYNEKTKSLELAKAEEVIKYNPGFKPGNIFWIDPDSFPEEEPIKGDFITVDLYPLAYNKKRKRYEPIPVNDNNKGSVNLRHHLPSETR